MTADDDVAVIVYTPPVPDEPAQVRTITRRARAERPEESGDDA